MVWRINSNLESNGAESSFAPFYRNTFMKVFVISKKIFFSSIIKQNHYNFIRKEESLCTVNFGQELFLACKHIW